MYAYTVMKNKWWVWGILVWLMACTESEYSRLVKRELATGQRKDSIFLSFRLGDTRKEFYAKGWEINKTGQIRQGPGNNNIEYLMPDERPGHSSIQMLFFPDFSKGDTIRQMNLSFTYTGWFPVNNQFHPDTLLVALKDTLMNWYGGNPFLLISRHQQPKDLWVKVDGNRQITLYSDGFKEVVGKIEDISVKYGNLKGSEQ